MGATEDLILLTFIMFVLTLAFGMLPIKCQLGSFYNNLIATFAAGLLLGTACIVILPEGLEMLLHGLESHDDHDDHEEEEEHHEDEDHEEEEHHEEEHHEDEHGEEELNGMLVGLAILAGIVFMLLVHRLGPKHSHGHGHADGHATDQDQGEQPVSVDASDNPKGDKGEIRAMEIEAAGGNEEISIVLRGNSTEKKQTISAVTLGLLMHAMFDGVALGIVTAGEEDSKITWVVFGALMGHKGTEAISLTVILLTQNLSSWAIFLNVLLFSASAPLMALVTFFILEAGTESSEHAGDTLGYFMLFAGGTFLGVVFEHILPELKMSHLGNMTLVQILVFVIGAVIPTALPVDHGH